MIDHHAGQFFHTGGGFPAELILCFCGIAKELLHLGWSEVPGINLNKVGVVQADMFEGQFAETTNGNHFSSRNHVIVRLILLQHPPHGFDVISGKTPVSLRIEVAKEQFVLQAEFDTAHSPGDFSCNKCLTPPWRFVVEQNAT